MHTSSLLTSKDFSYFERKGEASHPIDFDNLCFNYNPQDRLAVVCSRLEEAYFHCAYLVLAFTTAFYDALRMKGEEFFEYPRHFCLFDGVSGSVNTRWGRQSASLSEAGAAWSQLDVWPECKWMATGNTAQEMLKMVHDLQMDRILWPEGFYQEVCDIPLPRYVYQTLCTQVKQVFYYAPVEEMLFIQVSKQTEELVLRGMNDLPVPASELGALKNSRPDNLTQAYSSIQPQDFLARFAHLFHSG